MSGKTLVPQPRPAGEAPARPTVLRRAPPEALLAELTPEFHARWALGAPLGSGGSGGVYLAEDRDTGAQVAVKFLAAELLDDEVARARFHLEGAALRGLAHPSLVRVQAWGVDGRRPYLVFELVEGRTLEEVLASGGLRDPYEVLPFLIQLLDGLQVTHARGVFHRDIKPSNVLVTASRAPKLVDFGMAKVVGHALTLPGVIVGTPEYMAPEHFQAGAPLDQRLDVYAVGVLLFELLAGEQPYQGTPAEVVQAHREEPVPALAARLPGLPDAVDLVLRRALAKDPEARFQNAATFKRALAACLAGLARVGYDPAVSRPPPER